MTSQISCIAHMKFTCEIARIENPNEQQQGRKPARHDHLAWTEDPPFLRELYSLFPKYYLLVQKLNTKKPKRW
uniref:SFRICE_012947 n=1 Tax=Spodoptera frugiperda TaxID=7108 RepID=A0A2H1VYJ8_SPOFR